MQAGIKTINTKCFSNIGFIGFKAHVNERGGKVRGKNREY